jgi:hypothetical protein
MMTHDPHSIVIARLDRAIQYAAASQLNTTVSGILGRPVKPGDDSCEDSARSSKRHFSRNERIS